MYIADGLIGFGFGLLASGLFFVGLYATVRTAARVRHPGALLAASAVVRVGLFLLAAYFVLRLGLASSAGFLVAFPFVRQVAISRLRPRENELRSA